MAEQLWRRCPEARLVKHPHKRSRWFCPCHGDWDATLLPVAPSALLIEDGLEAAVERMARAEYEANYGTGNPDRTWDDVPHEVRHVFTDWARRRLRAAAGEKP